MIRTPEFSIAPSATAALLARQWLGRRWLFFVVPVAAALVAGAIDWRWFVVALMMLFIIWPMALFFVWCNHALAPAAVRSSQPHAVEFGPDGLRVEYTPREGYRELAAESIPWREIRGVEHSRHTVVYTCADGRTVVVPAKILSAEQWRAVAAWRR